MLCRIGGERFAFDADPARYQLALVGRGEEHAHHFRWDGKADAVGGPGAAENGGGHADQPALRIEQRAAAVAGIDRGIGLNEELPIRYADAGARQAGHDAGGHGLANTERIADGHRDIPNLDPVAVGHANHRQHRTFGIDLEQREIEAGIGKQDLGLELAAITQRHQYLIGAFDDMIVGDDQAIGANDHAGTQRLLHTRLHRRTAEKPLHEFLVHIARLAIDFGRVDIDHRRRR